MKLHRFAILIAALTYGLLILGGLVHNTRSSLACPDWPLCFGQFFPRMVGGVLVEHSHRLTAATVGALTVVLLVGLVRRARATGESQLGWLGLAALGCVIAQGLLGGLTVLYRLPTWISTTHLAVSMLFFALLLYIALRLRPGAERAPALSSTARRWTALAAGTVYAEMILGALMRHLGAGLSCVEIPLCKGQLFPSGAGFYVQLHMLHRAMGVVVLAIVLAASLRLLRESQRRTVRALALAAPLLVGVQIALGLWSVASFLDALPVTAHLAVAAALLADLWSLHLIARGRLGAQAPAARVVEALGYAPVTE